MAWPFDSEEQLDEWVEAFIEEHKEEPPDDPDALEAFLHAKAAAKSQGADIETQMSDPDIFAIHQGHEEDVWRFILKVIARRPPKHVLGYLAAGLLEDLIAFRGSQFIDRIEAEAEKDPLFRNTLHGVWRSASSEEIWERVVRARGEEKDLLH